MIRFFIMIALKNVMIYLKYLFHLGPSFLTHNLTLNLYIKLFIVVQLYSIQNINTFSLCHLFLGHNTKITLHSKKQN